LVDFELTEDSDSEDEDDDDGYAKNDRLKPSEYEAFFDEEPSDDDVESDMTSGEYNDNDVGGTGERTQTKRWPKHGSEKVFVPFTIHGPSFSRRHIEIIKDAMREVQSRTCVKFVQHSGERNFITLKSTPGEFVNTRNNDDAT
jgi:hypothetical protein